MKLAKNLENQLEALIRLFYPAFCTVCKGDLSLSERTVCTACLSKIEYLPENTCRKCASVIPPFSGKTVCSKCRQRPHSIDYVRSLAVYDGPLKEILTNAKFGNKSWLYKLFARKISDLAGSNYSNMIDYIVPVPLDRKRRRKRPFNQSDIISGFVSKTLKIKTRRNVLKKVKNSKPQSSLPRKERLLNLKGAFRVRKSADIKGKNILLIDDVYTTGSTLNECASVLKKAGARRIYALTLAKSI